MRLRSRVSALTAFSVACICFVQVCNAQPGGGRGGPSRGRGFGGFSFGGRGIDEGSLLRAEAVHSELKLTESQKKKLEELQDSRRSAQRARFAEFRDLSAEDRAKRFAELRTEGAEFNKKLVAVLSENQKERFREVYLQMRGVSALLDEGVAKDLELTDEQTKKIREAMEFRPDRNSTTDFARFAEMSREEREAAMTKLRASAEKRRKESEDKAMAVLSDLQSELFELMKGEKVDFTIRDIMASGRSGRGGFGGGRGGFGGGRTGRTGREGSRGDSGGRGRRGRPESEDEN